MRISVLLHAASAITVAHQYVAMSPPIMGRSRVLCMAQTDMPRNVKEMVAQLRESVQASLSARESRIAVEMPLGFEFGVEGERAKRKGSARVLTTADISRSNRELARLFVGMFEGTGLVPLILFPTVAEAAAARKLWAAPGLEARVQALVPTAGDVSTATAKPTPAASRGSSGGGFGGSGGGVGGGKKGKGKGTKNAKAEAPPLTRVPAAAEVVVAVAPYEAQLEALRTFCDESGMDKLVILLNARVEDAAEKTAATRAFFEHAGEGGFQSAYTFVTQPLGVKASAAAPSGDPVVLWRSYPGEWVFARKPAIGPPRKLLVREGEEGRPDTSEMTAALEAEPSSLLGLLGG